MNILVTGGAGFIGSHLVDALIDLGYNVTIIDNLITGDEINLNPKAKFIKRDITSDLTEIFQEGCFDYVFHLAAQVDVNKSIADPGLDTTTNILGSLNILNNCTKFGVKKIIFSSSAAVYGDVDIVPTHEEANLNPQNPYGINKWAVERYLSYYKENFNLNYVILRYSNVYGPKQSLSKESGVTTIFVEKMLKGESIVIHGKGTQTRDFIYVKDIISANILAMKNKELNGIFNISTAQETLIIGLFKEINELLGSNIKALFDHKTNPGQERSCLDNKKFSKITGWRAKFSLKEGLKETVEKQRS